MTIMGTEGRPAYVRPEFHPGDKGLEFLAVDELAVVFAVFGLSAQFVQLLLVLGVTGLTITQLQSAGFLVVDR